MTTNNRLARAKRILPIVLNSTSYKESLKNAGLKNLEHRRSEQALIQEYSRSSTELYPGDVHPS